MYLLDTNVISELRKTKPTHDPNVSAWFSSVDSTECYVSVITILELELGILKIERRDPQQSIKLRVWLEKQVIATFGRQILSIGIEIARACAALHVPDPRSDRDALIAATANFHGLTVVTRNVTDFRATAASVLNPWNT